MELQSWQDKKNRLCKMIKVLSDHYGGDDPEWLREYCRLVIADNKEDLDVPLACFGGILKEQFIEFNEDEK